jgi:dTDP-4-dehydrorhamnose 3,5-epimerase
VIFVPAELAGAFIIELEPMGDERGEFARTFCSSEFKAHGLVADVAQCNLSRNRRRGTLRGMHYQAGAYAEAKLIRCVRGSVFDVLVDLRMDSPTFRQWMSVNLDSLSNRMLYAPPGVAHGFQTLEDETELLYQMSMPYAPQFQRAVRWDDPAFGIVWPDAERIISERDRNHPLVIF